MAHTGPVGVRVATAFVVHIPWPQVLLRAFVPQLAWKKDYIATVVAVFGTTISPYLFFWQATLMMAAAVAAMFVTL